MAQQLKLLTLLLLIVQSINGHSISMGTCPEVQPMDNFSIDKFLGNWYAIQKVGTASSCVTYNFTRDILDDNKLKVIQTSLHFLLDSTGVDHVYQYTGILETPDPTKPGEMKVDFPLSPGKSGFIVFNTDYQNFAGIFTCQKVFFGNSKSATILSRRPTLDKDTINALRDQLQKEGVDPHSLSIVDQSDCARLRTASRVISVDDKTLSAPNIASGVKKAGEVVGNGVKDGGEFLGKGISKLGEWTSHFINWFA